MRRFLWIVGMSLFIGVMLAPTMLVKHAWAVPSFARQTGMGCNACHTIWPRLTPFGRAFKVKAYTDTSQPTIKADLLDIPQVFPVSVRAKNWLYSKQDAGPDKSNIPDELAFFLAGRVTPNIGYFAEPVFEDGEWGLETMKIALAKEFGDNIFGAVAGRMEPGGADPYGTVTLMRRRLRHKNDVFAITRHSQFFYFAEPENVGGVVYGSFGDYLYASVGAFRGATGGGGVENRSLSADSPDGYGRILIKPFSLISFLNDKGDLAVGAYTYLGRENLVNTASSLEYDNNVKRIGADVNYTHESGDHLIELFGNTVNGSDSNNGSWVKVKHWGWSAQGSYYYKRRYGFIVQHEEAGSSQDSSLRREVTTFQVAFLPWQNVKTALEYSKYFRFGTKTGGAAQNESLLTLILDLAF